MGDGWRRKMEIRAPHLGALVTSGAVLAPLLVEGKGASLAGLLGCLGLLAGFGRIGSRMAGALVPGLRDMSRSVAAATLGVASFLACFLALGHCGLLRAEVLLPLVAVLVLCVSLGRGLGPEAASADRGPSTRFGLVEAAVAGLAVAFLAQGIWSSRYEPPGRSYDDLSYHLPAAATWYQHGDLRTSKLDMGDQSPTFYPFLGEAVAWLLLVPFHGLDFLARWSELPFFLLVLMALYALSRELGVGSRGALLAACLFATVPAAFPHQALSAGNDLALAFGFLASLLAGLWFARDARVGTGALLGAALGLVFASKYLGVLHLPLLLAAVGAAVLLDLKARRGPALLLLSAAILLAVGVGGYSYFRNLATTGNPMFPAPISPFGLQFPGWPAASLAHRQSLPEADIDPWRFLAIDTTQLGPFFRFTILVAALVAPASALFRAVRGRGRWGVFVIALLPSLVFWVFLSWVGDHRSVRYVLSGVGVGAVLFSWLLGRWRSRVPETLVSGAALGAAGCWFAWRLIQGPRAGTFLGLAVLAAVGVLTGPRSRRLAALAALAVVVSGSAGVADRYLFERDRRLAAPLARAWVESGSVVAYVGGNQPYPFYGSHLQRPVEVVPTTPALGERFHDWDVPPVFPFHGRCAYWLNNLRVLGVDRIVVVRGREQQPERGWMRKRPRLFQRVHADDTFEVWVPTARVGKRGALSCSARPPGDPVG